MKKSLKLLGIGPGLVVLTLLYSFLLETLAKRYHFDISITSFIPPVFVNAVAITLIMTGLVFLIPSFTAILKLSETDKLYTKGVYSVCRHPLYSSWIVLIVPGITLMLNSLVSLSVPFMMYLIFRLLIKKEETDMVNRYGNQYRDYKSQVGLLFPRIWRYKNNKQE